MNPLDIVRLLLGLGADLRDGSRWQASHKIDKKQTKQRPKVTAFDCGLEEGDFWFKFVLSEDGTEHTLRGVWDPQNTGEKITFDGNEVDDDDVIISHRIFRLQLRGVLEFQFAVDGVTHRYRFDCTLLRPIPI